MFGWVNVLGCKSPKGVNDQGVKVLGGERQGVNVLIPYFIDIFIYCTMLHVCKDLALVLFHSCIAHYHHKSAHIRVTFDLNGVEKLSYGQNEQLCLG